MLFKKMADVYNAANNGFLGPDAATHLCRALEEEMLAYDTARAEHFFHTGEDDFYGDDV